MKPRFVVTQPIPEPALEVLTAAGEVVVSEKNQPLAREELLTLVEGATGLVCFLHDRIDEELLNAAGPQLRSVSNVAVGYDNVSVPVADGRSVVVTNTPGVLTDSTADLALSLILMSTRRLGEAERFVRRGEPWQWQISFMLGTGLRDKTLGVIGLGEIGTATARRARVFGMKIAYCNRNRVDEDLEDELGAILMDLDELLAGSDVVSLHCPLTDETRHLIDADRLASMKPTAHLINTARGPVVDEEALATALKHGVIAGAGLDVFENEPIVNAALLGLENVVLIPHLGSATLETRTAMAMLAVRNAVAISAGEEALTPVGALTRARPQ